MQVGMYGVSRLIAAVGRQHLIPPVFARVHPRFGTPWVSTLVQGVATAVIALFTGEAVTWYHGHTASHAVDACVLCLVGSSA